MKKLLWTALALALLGCASNPLMTGKPQDWKGKPAADLRTAWGEPTKVIPQSGGGEIWEYAKAGEFVAPKEETTSFRLGGGGSSYNTGAGSGVGMFGASGGISTLKYDQRLSQYENVWRFLVKDGKVRQWYAARLVDGQVVWSDH